MNPLTLPPRLKSLDDRSQHRPAADLAQQSFGVGRPSIFHKDPDYAAFERVMAEAPPSAAARAQGERPGP